VVGGREKEPCERKFFEINSGMLILKALNVLIG
jgi:hypothetical protein